MKTLLYKTIILLFRGLGYIKRGVFWLFGVFWALVESLADLIRTTLGFRFYKWQLRIDKWLEKLKLASDKGVVGILGKRSTLQLLFLVAAVLISVPHSKLYNKDVTSIAGRKTILYSIVGPGEQNFEIERVKRRTLPTTGISPRWRQGAVASKDFGSVSLNLSTRNLTKMNIGGTALIRASIPPGTEIDRSYTTTATGTTKSAQREKIVEYTVKPGDVIGSIADRFGVTNKTILWANDLTYNSYIRPGDKLKILPVSGVLHQVTSGDTLAGIANKYDAEVEEIIDYNNLETGSSIQPGQKLIIPHGEKDRSSDTQQTQTEPSTQTQTQPRVEDSFDDIAASPPSVSTPAGSSFIWPTTVHTITQYFGWRHTGLDIAGPRGTSLLASKSGRVVKSSCGWNGGYGCYVVIDHGRGVRTLYAHAYRLLANRGERVTQGDTVALMGSTGRSTGPHIHFEVRVRGQRENPLKYIR
ncbi:MAG: peptidoglycan DD-metalloendopeptidase family protein [Candidatus Paceibacteria bacterium]